MYTGLRSVNYTVVPLTTSAHQSSSLAPTLIIWFNCGINTDHGSLPTLCKIVCKNLKNNNAVTFCQRKPQTAVNICIVHSLPVVRSHGWIYFQPILVNRRHHHQLWALGWLLHSIIAEWESCSARMRMVYGLKRDYQLEASSEEHWSYQIKLLCIDVHS